MTRRLAAIMFTDTVGFTASTQSDEARTLELLREQQSLVRPLIVAHLGREIKSTGDGFLVEFDSALRATECAIEIQKRIHERNARPGVFPIQIRIGIHLGDVEQQGADILGDAVNIAARIEPVATPGGVCVSGAIQEQVRNKISVELEKLPPTALKGLQSSMDIFRIVMPWTARGRPSATSGPKRLAVLPFANISPDPMDEYFADGLTEELITVLSQLRELRVIARTSVTQYKLTNKSVSQIGAELGVDTVMEGSVRKSGDQLRITIQLIDVGTQEHTWANTYDRKLDNVFAVQTEIARRVAKQLKINVRASEEERLDARPRVLPDSYLAYLKGRTLQQGTTQASLEASKDQFARAIELDPRNAAAHSGLSDVLGLLRTFYPTSPKVESVEASRKLAARAIELDPNLAEAHTSLALLLWEGYDYTGAVKELQLALSLNPSYSLAHYWYAEILEDQGRPEEAFQEFTLAEAADPLSPRIQMHFAELLRWMRRPDEAFARIQKLGELEPSGQWVHFALARYYIGQSDFKRGLEEIRRIEELEQLPRRRPIHRAWYLAVAGEKDQSRELLRREETLPSFAPTAWVIPYIYAELGDLDECFRWIERAIDDHNYALQPFRLDPRLERVRNDPRFQIMLKKMNLA